MQALLLTAQSYCGLIYRLSASTTQRQVTVPLFRDKIRTFSAKGFGYTVSHVYVKLSGYHSLLVTSQGIEFGRRIVGGPSSRSPRPHDTLVFEVELVDGRSRAVRWVTLRDYEEAMEQAAVLGCPSVRMPRQAPPQEIPQAVKKSGTSGSRLTALQGHKPTYQSRPARSKRGDKQSPVRLKVAGATPARSEPLRAHPDSHDWEPDDDGRPAKRQQRKR
jgi:hypothetical protein